jgi:hypothetical protein
MSPLSNLSHLRFACLGTFVPRRCGIATFSHDLCEAICRELADEEACQFVAVNDLPSGYAYSTRVRFEIRQQQTADYQLAADFINIRNLHVLLVQHELGIFGGSAGSHLLSMLRDVTMPVVTTMHTVLCKPNEDQHRVTCELASLSDRIVVMAKRAQEILTQVYNVPPEKIVMIPHGIPDVAFVDPAFYKDQFGVEASSTTSSSRIGTSTWTNCASS